MQEAYVHTGVLEGLEARPVTLRVAVDPTRQAGVTVGGQALERTSQEWQETVATVRMAISHAGLPWPGGQVSVTAEPGHGAMPRPGEAMDLALAAGVLAASGAMPGLARALDHALLAGSLSRPGVAAVAEPRGGVAYDALASRQGLTLVTGRRAHDDGLSLAGIANLRELASLDREIARGPGVSPYGWADAWPASAPQTPVELATFTEVEVLAALASAVGGHVVLMRHGDGFGADGYDLSALVTRLLPPLTADEAADVELACSVADVDFWPYERPLRSPHHGITAAGLLGGGRPVAPGEVTLASHGVLLLDEAELFEHAALTGVAHAASEGSVAIARVGGANVMPASTRVICASAATAKELAFVASLADVRVEPDDSRRVFADGMPDLPTLEAMVAEALEFREWRIERERDAGRVESEHGPAARVSRTLADLDRSEVRTWEHIRMAETLCGTGLHEAQARDAGRGTR